MNNQRICTAVVISPSWPIPNSGTGFAVTSALRQYIDSFCGIHFVGLVDHPFVQRDLWYSYPIKFSHVPIKRYSRSIRFILSLASQYPAICWQFLGKKISDRIVGIIAEERRKDPRIVVIFEDLPIPMALLAIIRSRIPNLCVAVRSENVASKIFVKLRSSGSYFHRFAWGIEIAKICKREIMVRKLADQLWAISKNDLEEYKEHLNVQCDGVFSVSVDVNRYSLVPPGDSRTLVSIGTVDMRKSLGLQKFIEKSWPEVVRRYPTAKLLLGGANSEQFADLRMNVLALGRVGDDRDILSQGLIMLNTQEIGSGINLKSIVAMVSGKALVSTQKGVEGIEGKAGEHFLVAPDVVSLAPLILELMDNPDRARQMGKAAQELASTVYSEAHLSEQVQPLLRNLVLRACLKIDPSLFAV